MKKLLLIIFVSTLALGEVNFLSPVFSHVFSFPNSRWDFMMDKDKYGVEIAGFLKDTTWANSPVIIYSEVIKTNYYFDLFNTITITKKMSQFKTIQYQKKQIDLESNTPFTLTFWILPNIVYEYIAYFSIDKNHIVAIVLSSKDRKYIEKYYNDYKTILRNFARTADSLK